MTTRDIPHVHQCSTMPLLRLPSEVLKQIFDYISPSFFHEDLGRLTVCKEWLDFALPAYFRSITVSQKTLSRLVKSPVAQRPFLLRNSLETIDLELWGLSCPSTVDAQDPAQDSILPEDVAPDEISRDGLVSPWTRTLNAGLTQLAIMAQQAHKLRTLRMQARMSLPPNPLDRPEDYLSLRSMRALLSVDNLNVLKLDLCGSSLILSGEEGNDCHICPAINTLLRSLRTLHLRLRNVCPDVLKPPDINDSLHLSEVVINLSLTTNLPGITSAAHAKRCGSGGGGLPQLKAEIQEQAETLATRMMSPRLMRILTHTLPFFKIQSLDILTGKTMELGDDVAWDEDGKFVEENSEPESEIEDDESSVSLDG